MTFADYISLVHAEIARMSESNDYASLLIQDYEVELRQAFDENVDADDIANHVFYTDLEHLATEG